MHQQNTINDEDKIIR